MKCLVLFVILTTLSVQASDGEEKVPELISNIKSSFEQMSKSYDECKWNIPDGPNGLDAFFKKAYEEFRKNAKGEQTIFSCTIVRDGRYNGDYLKITWGPGSPPNTYNLVG
ncbi:unnamed protein product [Bursaphelenchus okinawaensis]|uniref:Uncharacterized protein n=1 Tax=Bursaphelenchus okinawaensis TaxID=465554 RepID=A0A811KLA1_9BILA|nr:unnamed protein product [Bursaphelenchus okinawaensis]CAG9106073.1 unnamed protein product [Bursaphelenchus okinawaensis]